MLFVIKLFSYLPIKVGYIFSDVLRILIFGLFKYRSKVIKENIQNAFPEKTIQERNIIIKQFQKNFCDVLIETLRLFSMSENDLKKYISIKNIDLPESFLIQKQSIVVLTSHLCNWEWLLQGCVVATDYKINAVYKPLHNSKTETLTFDMRSKFGAKPVAMKDTLREVLKIKRDKSVEVIAMVADQTPPWSEIQHWQTFFNQNTPFYIGGDKLSYVLEAPVFFAKMKRLRRGYYEISFDLISEPPYEKDKHTITEKYIQMLELEITNQPGNWLWSHKRWKHTVAKIVRSNTQLNGVNTIN
jgi:KDO2-lipid IV(A) lauroyltransferase